jgi:hypothetical protein
MQKDRAIYALGILLAGLLCLAGLHNASAHQSVQQTGSVCHGFVILSNGYAVLSGVPAMQAHGTASMHHGAMHQHTTMRQTAPGPMTHQGHPQQPADSHGTMPAQHHEQMEPGGHMQAASPEQHRMEPTQPGQVQQSGQPTAAASHLMGYQHGQAIVLRQGMLCVPIGGQEDTQWMAVSRDPKLFVMAESLRGPLAHNSRANEGFALTVMRQGQDLSQAQVRLLVRMPQHDRHMPGGHGVANDPDVQGLQARRDGKGLHVVHTVDFSMPGPWLAEVQVRQNSDIHTAYFAIEVGEE